MGAAYLAGLAAGYWKNQEEVKKIRRQTGSLRGTGRKDPQDHGPQVGKAVRYAYGWAQER